MKTRRFPEFGKELERGFPVHENCYDCVEFYGGCNAWPESKTFRCADYYPLPDVMPGTSGQVFPPSRMQGRKEPRARKEPASDKSEQPQRRQITANRRQSPAANYGPDGERLCECGARLRKRRRCCDTCRLKRRGATRCRSRERTLAVVDPGSDGLATPAGRPTTLARINGDN